MIKETSREAYEEIKARGLLKGWQWDVYDCVSKNPGITQGECWSEHFPEYQRHTVAPRFAELLRMGVIRDGEKRKCRVSDFTCQTWYPTTKVPEEKPKQEAKRTFYVVVVPDLWMEHLTAFTDLEKAQKELEEMGGEIYKVEGRML